ncbi:ATP-binding protein [Neorhizobium alkalisoli]|uniref:Uncharacterized protein YhaN n=1 Tax=Neorhizobium alkalisoli TaxID=528178 RepID=A0A561R210_9HYPH|nr:YhaN family protein [Neorhizobium alkalisoli]TWF56657.1 uncharacterized protein YhaN [Neorhizobium alkalisoli]
MRFNRLDILRYGALTDRSLRFRPGAGLHVVYGPNEAGKSSALSAISDLLFGFPEKSDYTFRHDSASLRVGAEILSRDGGTLNFRRRKGRKNTLLAATEAEEPLSDDALAPFLGNLSRDVFQRAFGLDSDSLRAGGETMLKSGGEIGSLLFSAASGLNGLSDLRRSLEAEADSIYGQRKSKDRRFYQVLDAHDEARRAERDNELKAGDWKKLIAEQAEIEASIKTVQTARVDTKGTLDRLNRRLRLQPLLREIDLERDRLAAYAGLATLPAGFEEELATLLDRARQVAEAHQAAGAEVSRLKDEIATVHVDEELIASAPAILAVHADKGAYLKAREDIARVRAEVEDFETRLLHSARRLGFSRATDLEGAQPADADLVRLKELVGEGENLDRELKQLRKRIDEERDALRKLEADAAGGRLVDPKPWSDRLIALRPDLAELSAIENLTVRVKRAESDLAAAAARLDPPVRDVERLLSVNLPEIATLVSQQRVIEAARLESAQAAQKVAQLQQDVADVTAALAALEGGGQIVSREKIAEAREGRDALIGLLAEKPSAAAMDAARQAVTDADRLSDAALDDAERVLKHTQLVIRQRELDQKAAAARRAANEASIAAADAVTEFEDLFQVVPVSLATPERMIEWRRSLDGIFALSGTLADARDAIETLRLKEEALQPAMQALADAVGVAGGVLPLTSLARELERRLEELGTSWNERRTLERLQSSAREQLGRFEEQQAGLDERVEEWRQRFMLSLTRAGLGDDATTEMALAALDVWRTIPSIMSERDNRERRVRGMSRDMEHFEETVSGLCSRIAAELTSLPADVAAGQLNSRAIEAQTAEHRRATLLEGLARAELSSTRWSEEASSVDLALTRSAEQAAVEPAELHRLLADLRERREVETSLTQSRRRFAEQADGALEADIRTDLAEFDRIAAGIEIERLQAEDDRQVETLRTLGIAQANNERRRQELETGIGAERAVFQKRASEEEARELARRWVVLKLAADLLASSMETYREQQADPVMMRAGEVFSALTDGRFSRLVQLYDEADELRLAVERQAGEQVPLSGLSEGTGDQLYLALRLAFLEDYCSRNEPAPLILDDVFQTFDDERTAAGLKVLAAAGDRFQTILFTHQLSLVDAAEKELGDAVDVVRLERL